MNIGPTQTVPLVAENRSTESPRKPSSSPPNPGNHPQVETTDTQTRKPADSLSSEVVKVHSDTTTGSPILVYEFMDARSGSVVFQIPSDQMLNLVQDIRQRLQRMAGGEQGARNGGGGRT